MKGRPLVRPLEDDWLPALEAVARARGYPSPREVAKLGARVAALSAAYNDPARARASALEAGAARLGFSFARDVPKVSAAVVELLAAGWTAPQEVRVLDVGAGLGAATWGVARALEPAGSAIVATWVDSDAHALDLGLALLRERAAQGRAVPRVLHSGRAEPLAEPGARFQLVLASALLSELDVDADEPTRAARHAALLGGWIDRRLAPGGALVVVEPALRDRTRHLHRVRDALLASGAATVVAPCLHAAPCPMLPLEGEWCHEDLAVDLPAWLAPVARAAGLRREGLTFSFLVLRAPSAPLLRARPAAPASHLRIVSSLLRTKGKREVLVCGDLGSDTWRTKAVRLDRDASAANAAWEDLLRGDVVELEPSLEVGRPRIGAQTQVRVRARQTS